MLNRDEVTRSLAAAWDLFLDRPGALNGFDISIDGFWRSFAALILIVPPYALTMLSERQSILSDAIPDDGFSDPVFILSKAIALCIDWVALPVVLALVARPLNLARNYSAFVIARNWGSVLAIFPFGLIALLMVLDWISADTANFLSLAALIVVLRYNYVIARRALGANIGLSVAVVTFDLFLSLLITLVVDGVFGT